MNSQNFHYVATDSSSWDTPKTSLAGCSIFAEILPAKVLDAMPCRALDHVMTLTDIREIVC